MTEPSAKPSRTSLYVAAGRAVGAREPDPAVRNPDTLAELLLGDPADLDIDHPSVRALGRDYAEVMRDPEVVGSVIMMMIRTRFIDDGLRRAVAAGATQVVILGAGFDTRAYRFAGLLREVRVFEVDRPQTQNLKRRRVEEVLGGPPSNLTYVPIDFQREGLAEVLARHGHDRSRRTFFVWEGVTMYLPEEAVRATLRFVASHAAGSTIAFDFIYRGILEMIAAIDMEKVPEQVRPMLQRFLNLVKDEPWIFGVPTNNEREFLKELGLEAGEVLPIGGPESVKRYLTRADGTIVGGSNLASAPQASASHTAAYQLAEATVIP